MGTTCSKNKHGKYQNNTLNNHILNTCSPSWNSQRGEDWDEGNYDTHKAEYNPKTQEELDFMLSKYGTFYGQTKIMQPEREQQLISEIDALKHELTESDAKSRTAVHKALAPARQKLEQKVENQRKQLHIFHQKQAEYSNNKKQKIITAQKMRLAIKENQINNLTKNLTAATDDKNTFEAKVLNQRVEIQNLQKLRRQEKQTLRKPPNAKQNKELENISKKYTKLIQELKELKKADECSVCYEVFNDDVHRMACFKSCGHILCYQCAHTIVSSQQLCHQCRAKVSHTNKILIIYK